MRILLTASFITISILSLKAQFAPFQSDKNYTVFIDLNDVVDDKLKVVMVPPISSEDSVEFHMPRIVPGTYDIHNYGRFVSELSALTASGDELKMKKLDLNRWRIYDAKKLYKISYRIDDTFDADDAGIFEPAGTSIEDSVFLLNNFGIIGYVDAYRDYPFTLEIAKPNGFYGSTALDGEMGDSLDVFKAKDYFTLHDNPILYCIPDTTSLMVGGAEVLVSLYSPARLVSSAECMDRISAVLAAAADYLGGSLPVDKYAVLIYCVPLEKAGTGFGALEHHTSTVLYMPEFSGERFYGSVRDITSHEFFHIVTPLNIHSEYINDFDFIDPDMSAHIWLYEGVTEYNSHLVQIRNGIYTMDDFIDIIKEKLNSADRYDKNIPLTLASKHTLTFLKDQYLDFYQKGALAGMALDLKLRSLSNGEYGLINLLNELGSTYGPDTFFADDQLFDIITEMTYPEMREFLARHYEGTDPFPLEELLGEVGMDYRAEYEEERISAGNVGFGYNLETGRLKIDDISDMNDFGREMGFQEGDELIEFNGTEANLGNISDLIQDYYANTKPGDKVTMVMARPKGEGKFKKVKLKAKARLDKVKATHLLQESPSATADQLLLRKTWINQ